MRKAQAKAAKRAAKEARRALAETWPVFLCEPSGMKIVTQRFECLRAGHVWHVDLGRHPRLAEIDSDWDSLEPCPECGANSKLRSVAHERIMQRADTKEELPWPLPPGAVWAETDYPHRVGPDGRELHVMLPDGHTWNIDSRASNCTMPDDNLHYCWVRHGKPEDGTLHVDKNGPTCAAGAGSIKTAMFHGFLHHGVLKPC